MHEEHVASPVTGRPARGSQTESRQDRLPQIIAITSGKGGVGKSSIAVNLGITLARYGRRVCILDADTGLANVNILLGLRPVKSLEHVLSGDCPIEDIMMEGPHRLRVIPGASGISECVNLDPTRQRRLVNELARIEKDFDYLLVDTAAGIAETTLDFLSAAHRVLLVITPEPTSLTDAFSLLKLALRRHPVECHVIVNMAGSFNEARSVFQRFEGATLKYLDVDVSFLGFILRDESMRSAVALQHPVALFAEGDPSARPFQRLADALEENPLQQPMTQSFSRFWFRRFLQPSRGAVAPEEGEEEVWVAPAGMSEEAPAAPEAVPAERGVAEPEQIQRLQAEFRKVLDAVDDPRLIADWLEELHSAYWERFGSPGLDLPGMVERLAADPERHAEILVELRHRLRSSGGGTLAPDEEPAVEAATVPTALPAAPAAQRPPEPAGSGKWREPRPDFGMRGEGKVEARMSPTTPPSRSVQRSPHAYDVQQFGPQQALAERLRRMNADGPRLVDLIRRL